MATLKVKATLLVMIVLLLVMMAIPAYGQSILEFAETCDDASGQCAYWQSLAPNTCEEPDPEELVCSDDNPEAPERDDTLPMYWSSK